jgi:hypothetical protein
MGNNHRTNRSSFFERLEIVTPNASKKARQLKVSTHIHTYKLHTRKLHTHTHTHTHMCVSVIHAFTEQKATGKRKRDEGDV